MDTCLLPGLAGSNKVPHRISERSELLGRHWGGDPSPWCGHSNRCKGLGRGGVCLLLLGSSLPPVGPFTSTNCFILSLHHKPPRDATFTHVRPLALAMAPPPEPHLWCSTLCSTFLLIPGAQAALSRPQAHCELSPPSFCLHSPEFPPEKPSLLSSPQKCMGCADPSGASGSHNWLSANQLESTVFSGPWLSGGRAMSGVTDSLA